MTPWGQHHYAARCERDGRAWSVDVPELRIHTFGHTLADAEDMARDAVATLLDVPVEQVSVSLEVLGASESLREVADARGARVEADTREREAVAKAVATLLEMGASQRDAARLLGMSHQRISQIAGSASAACS